MRQFYLFSTLVFTVGIWSPRGRVFAIGQEGTDISVPEMLLNFAHLVSLGSSLSRVLDSRGREVPCSAVGAFLGGGRIFDSALLGAAWSPRALFSSCAAVRKAVTGPQRAAVACYPRVTQPAGHSAALGLCARSAPQSVGPAIVADRNFVCVSCVTRQSNSPAP